MANLLILGQKAANGKMVVRGVFTTKKGFLEALNSLTTVDGLIIADDVGGREGPVDYALLCEKIRKVGRASFMRNGEREFQVIETETNQIRGLDYDDEGKPRCNPVK